MRGLSFFHGAVLISYHGNPIGKKKKGGNR